MKKIVKDIGDFDIDQGMNEALRQFSTIRIA
jgi:hypothetical protein